MAHRSPRQFSGFSREALDLLRDLEWNSSRAWFTAHREQFSELLVHPAIDLVRTLRPLLHRRLSPGLRAEPAVGGSVVGHEREPGERGQLAFRNSLELRFWEGAGSNKDHSCFFVRIASNRLELGAGIDLFPPEMLQRYREAVDQSGTGRELAALLRRLEASGAEIGGPQLRRTPHSFAHNHERIDLLRMLGLWAVRVELLPEGAPEVLLGALLPELIVGVFVRLSPLWRWLVALEAAE